MKIYIIRTLNWDVVNSYGDRKEAGYLSIIVNMDTRDSYAVPASTEHIDFLTKILGVDKKYIKNNPMIAEHLIPVLIQTKHDSIYGVLTGFSGAESGYNVRHTKEHLVQAHNIALELVDNGEIPKHKDFKNEIIYRYSIKS